MLWNDKYCLLRSFDFIKEKNENKTKQKKENTWKNIQV